MLTEQASWPDYQYKQDYKVTGDFNESSRDKYTEDLFKDADDQATDDGPVKGTKAA